MRPHSTPRRAAPGTPDHERFWLYVLKTDACWLWQGAMFRAGYGQFAKNHSQHISAHRFAWEEANGPIPEGMALCHHCDTPACVRPDHLFLGTQQDNITDMMVKGRFRGAAGHRRSLCRAGLHEWTPENTLTCQGHRKCRECWNAYMREYQHKRRQRIDHIS